MEPEIIEQAVNDDRAAMQAGFNASLDGAEAVEAETVIEDAPTEEPEEDKPEDEPRMLGFTESELKQRLDKIDQLEAKFTKTHDSVFGRVGDVQQAIKDLQAAQKSGRTVTAEQFTKLNSEVGVDVVNAIVEGLNHAPAEPEAPAFDPVSFEQNIRQSLKAEHDAVLRSFDERAFKKDHPDFQTFKVSEGFKAFLATKSADDQRAITTSQDYGFAGEKLSEAKRWVAAQKPPETPKPPKKLEANITPKGAGTAPVRQDKSDAAEMLKGFQAVFKN